MILHSKKSNSGNLYFRNQFLKLLFYSALVLAVSLAPWVSAHCIAENKITSFSLLLNNELVGDDVLTLGSPLAQIDLIYTLTHPEKIHSARIYRGHNCSLTSENVTISNCNETQCQVGTYSDFDITFESKGKLYHVFNSSPRSVKFSVELITADAHGALSTSCQNSSVQVDPCDKIISTDYGQNKYKMVTFEFVDSETERPLDNVEISLSRGPVPNLVRHPQGIVELRSIPRDGIFYLFSRDVNHRFVLGPFENQLSENGLSKIKLGLCDKKY